ncbi:hypothetical protein AVEN_83589-1 [Araneus ventricosus]|uniref:Uncharacterized protein n=1 Tax=Araneus ventricosus TaxID=182803 RepID=A0A4Y2QJR0_ARAVE|nr:hypothetical protein AVEN_130558-1 [Araneus ventricosus]GBN63587.1 hypothetical protein AVEN_129336-1 [Araneus ventricosus]GBN64371.1 hypothetical protein AVEN_76925-1 [Araneus ventricosus]GBN64431.1 hypothetical protein AVEN_83589-1 [Araneus ventricosus]
MFCQWCDRIYSTSTKKVVLTCGHYVHKCCAKHLDRPSSLWLRFMKPLTGEDMDEILRVSRDASMDDDASSTDSWTDSSTESSTDDEMNASTDECQAM